MNIIEVSGSRSVGNVDSFAGNAYFDKELVLSAVDSTRREVFRSTGEKTVSAARAMIRDGGGGPPWARRASRGGEPPLTHTGWLRDSIDYAIDVNDGTILIGVHGNDRIASLLEFGGLVSVPAYRDPEGFVGTMPHIMRLFGTMKGITREGEMIVTYPARPFMRPAMEVAMSALNYGWNDAVNSISFASIRS